MAQTRKPEDKGAQIRRELAELIVQGTKMVNAAGSIEDGDSDKEGGHVNLVFQYQSWYTRALPVVRQLLPDRYTEFQEQYKIEKRKDITFATYTISDYLIGLRITRGVLREEDFDATYAFTVRLLQQVTVLQSALSRLDSVLADIHGLLQAGLFDHDLLAARDLLKSGHLRAAGAVAGVVLETHLGQFAATRGVKVQKKEPTIGDLNEALKAADVIDIPDWRLIQRLSDIRNLCVHSKERDPTKDEVDDLVRGTDKVVKTML
ncbi:MAG: hypothetical protein IH956_01085 [Chloroflexi bacterium]|nr:hypothetical protein [Chloroflexota bacterium]